jgi:hypothetical protein
VRDGYSGDDKRMKRRLFTILSVLSLLVCIAVAVLWIRSYWTADYLVYAWRSSDDRYEYSMRLGSSCGGLGALSQRLKYAGPKEAAFLSDSPFGWRLIQQHKPDHRAYFYDDTRSFFARLGLHLNTDSGPCMWGDYSETVIAAPHWAVLTVLAMPAMLCAAKVQWKVSRPKIGLCPTCGYDLRATPDHCPQCGAPVAAKGAA